MPRKTNYEKLQPIKHAKDVYLMLKRRMNLLDREHFIVLHLNSKNFVIQNETVAVGTLNSAIIHPREVFKGAIMSSANTIIIVHNHPSGDPTPSEEDKRITSKLFQAGELLGIKVLDHIIIGKNSFYGFIDENENAMHGED